MFFHHSVVQAQAKEIQADKIFSEARKDLPQPPLPQPPATSDSSKSNTFTDLKRERLHSYAENIISLIVQRKDSEKLSAIVRGSKWHVELDHLYEGLQPIHCPLAWLN